ncbi:MAG: glycosyltransferase family 4 protein [Gammaproteobacteria bacterium]|nr:glycosyltransferase family 4 protein [Gammaproteobacteria bacterium]
MRAAFLLPIAHRQLALLHKEQHFDLVHADLPTSGFLARFLGRRSHLPVLYTEHNLQERYHPATRLTNRLTYGWNDQVFAVSDEVAASIHRNGLAKTTPVTVLLNGVPVEQVRAEAGNLDGLRAELALPTGRPVVGSVAVFRRQKRLVDWVETAAKIAEKREDALFLLAGDGPEMAAVRARVDELGLGKRFRLPGFREDGRRLLGLMDVYVMSSEHEGLPITLLEAMALGKPVVSTRVGGVPEVVQDGVHGFLTPIGATDALAESVLRLLADPTLAKAMGEAGAAHVEDAFHLRRRVVAIESVYDEILASSEPKARPE